jgi:acyl carrier protein
MTEGEIYEGLKAIFEATFRRTGMALRPDMTAADVPGWDSFRFVSLIMGTEERFSIKFSDADLEDFNNVGDLANAVARKLSART